MEEEPYEVDLALIRQGITSCGARLHDARQAADTARRELRSRSIEGVGLGLSEAEVARLAGVTRQTVRGWLGKTQ
jgi:hypothetical protein